MLGLVGALWGIAGVVLLISSAIYRMTPVAAEAFTYPLQWYHWLVAVVFLAFMLYSEGYRGFQRGFSPRVVARAHYLRQHPRTLHVVLAPLFCMGFFYATRRRQMTSILVTSAIVIAILTVRLVVQPWRGIIDLGVVAGLVWGVVALAGFAVVGFTSESFSYSPDVPLGADAPGDPV